ncbi:MAG: hypothetical protein NC393_04255 [Clostridium sp.]|nr:hypothetical protein [Clostridium sp.]MCM1171322.1 hypothetical protein [Clostridium sp.]MCM1209744.1 hypothetical protein [Ruminococcus sp.]
MTDSEKLDLLLVKFGSMENDISGLKEDVRGLKEDVSGLKEDVRVLKEDVSGLKEDVCVLKRDYKKLNNKLNKSVKELKTMDCMILDEVERVHAILDMHKADKTVHTA